MLRRWRFVLVILSLVGVRLTWAADEAALADRKFGIMADLTVSSKYITDGFKIGGDNPVWQPSIAWDVFSTGFSLLFSSAVQMYRNNQQFDELDFFVRYSNDLFQDSAWKLNLHGYYGYWFYPKSSTEQDDGFGETINLETLRGNKLHAGLSLPRRLRIADYYLVPSYNVYYWLYWAQNQWDRFQGGTRHELLLQYYHDIPAFFPGATGQYVGVGSSVNYNDGAFGVHPGWSHTTAQLANSVYTKVGTFSLGFNYQWSHEASVDPNNEFWSSLSFTKQF